jgi:hypothetical protein
MDGEMRSRLTTNQVKESKHTVTTDRLLQITNLSQRRVLTASAKQVTEEVTSDTAGTTAIEERERFLVVCRGLVVLISHDEDVETML